MWKIYLALDTSGNKTNMFCNFKGTINKDYVT